MKKVSTRQEDQFTLFLFIIFLSLSHQTIVLYACLQPQNTINSIVRNALYKEGDPAKYPRLNGNQYAFLIDLTIATERNRKSQHPKPILQLLQQQIDALVAPAPLDESQEKLYRTKSIAKAIVGPEKAPGYLERLTHSLFHDFPSLFILEAMNKRIHNQKDKVDVLLPNILAICNEPISKNAKLDCIIGLRKIFVGAAVVVTGSLLACNSDSENIEPDEITAGSFFGIPIMFSGGYYAWYGAQEVIKGLRILFW